MKLANLLVLSLLGSTSIVAYADTNADIAKCSSESNSVKRLECFDLLSKRLGLASPATSTIKAAKWVVSSETSKIDDRKNVTITLEANSAISGWPGKTHTPSLVIRCKERKTEAYIVTGMAAQVEYGNFNGATVTLRFDKETAAKYRTSESTDKEALFFSQSTSLIKKMMQHSSLLFEFVPFNSSPQMTTFDIQGLSDAIRPLREVCKW